MSGNRPSKMKASVMIKPGEVRIEERPLPEVGPDRILIKVDLCGICGTELLVYEGKFPVEQPYYNLGHEYTGEVVEVGSQVKSVSAGDRVVINPNYHCDCCYYCRRGELGFCENRRAYKTKSNGGFAEYTSITEKLVYRVPKEMPAETAIFAESLSCCVHGVDLLDIEPGAAVVIMGCGSMGLLTLQLCKLRGAGRIIASDPVKVRRTMAKKLGADIVVDPLKEDLDKIVSDTCAYGPGIVVEIAGAKQTIHQALKLVGRKGQVLLLAIWPEDVNININPALIVNKEITVKGAVFGSLTLGRAIDLLADNKIEAASLISHKYSLDDLSDALETAKSRDSLKVAVSF